MIKATKEGRLYIEIEDLLKSPKIQKTIEELLESEIVKEIEERKNNKRSNGGRCFDWSKGGRAVH